MQGYERLCFLQFMRAYFVKYTRAHTHTQTCIRTHKRVQEWMDKEENADKWCEGKLNASGRRILITHWLGKAVAKVQETFPFYRVFERCVCVYVCVYCFCSTSLSLRTSTSCRTQAQTPIFLTHKSSFLLDAACLLDPTPSMMSASTLTVSPTSSSHVRLVNLRTTGAKVCFHSFRFSNVFVCIMQLTISLRIFLYALLLRRVLTCICT
jgi:hypothetical protein